MPMGEQEGKGMGRRTKLTKEVREELVALVEDGSYFEVACRAVGVAPATAYEWIAWGEGRAYGKRKPPPNRRPYTEFAEAVARAGARAETSAIDNWRRGFTEEIPVLDREGVPVRDPDDPDKILMMTRHDWKAAAEYLRRRHVDRWGRERVDVNVAMQQYGQTVASLFRSVLDDPRLELSPRQRAAVPEILRDVLPRFAEAGETTTIEGEQR